MAEDQQGMAAVTGPMLKADEMLSTPDLIAVGVRGDDVRRRIHGAKTTFVRVFETHVGAPPSVLPPGVSAGEFRIVGKPVDAEAAVAAVRATVELADGRAPVTGFSLADLRALSSSAADVATLCRRLRDAGLMAIADAPLDMFLDEAGGEEAARAALDVNLALHRLTVHAQPPAGARETEARIAMVERARRLQAELSCFRAFAPLPRAMSIAAPTTGYQDIKQIALARVVVENIPSIQVDWPLYGPKLAQVALTVGADDVDGIEAHDPGVLGTRRSPLEEIKNNIRAAALDPVERRADFSIRT